MWAAPTRRAGPAWPGWPSGCSPWTAPSTSAARREYVEERYAADLLSGNTTRVGYLLKDRVADVEEFLDALRRVASGGTALDPEVVSQLLLRRRSDPLDRLTAREREVLALMAEGRSNAAIAAELVVSDSAVAKHINSIFTKLDLPRPRRTAAGCWPCSGSWTGGTATRAAALPATALTIWEHSDDAG